MAGAADTLSSLCAHRDWRAPVSGPVAPAAAAAAVALGGVRRDSGRGWSQPRPGPPPPPTWPRGTARVPTHYARPAAAGASAWQTLAPPAGQKWRPAPAPPRRRRRRRPRRRRRRRPRGLAHSTRSAQSYAVSLLQDSGTRFVNGTQTVSQSHNPH